jgi:toxin YoeB
MIKLWQDEAWEDYVHWQTEDRKTLKKINKLLVSIDRNGYTCIGKPEPLKHDKRGYWSVEIDEKNRIVFRIKEIDNEKHLEIAQCGSHYRDK